MESRDLIGQLNKELVDCRLCPRLVEWREKVATEKRKQYATEGYWGKPVPYFGDPDARLLILGLAPAAHGANRTGRMFTGDRSGDFLFAALHRAGLASQAESVHLGDGLKLTGVLMAASCHCAPPDNKPLPSELTNCSRYLVRLLESGRFDSILCLGRLAWTQLFRVVGEPAAAFSHAGKAALQNGTRVVGSYHPSQQNTFTGRLTSAMLDQAIKTWASPP